MLLDDGLVHVEGGERSPVTLGLRRGVLERDPAGELSAMDAALELLQRRIREGEIGQAHLLEERAALGQKR
jgi:hypothetical protein